MSKLPHGFTQELLNIVAPQVDDDLRNPAIWVRSNMGEFVPPYQEAIMVSTAANRYTAVPSSHDTGKSFTASRIARWWLERYPPGEAFVVTTAPTVKQIHAVLWREFARANERVKDSQREIRITMNDEARMKLGLREELVAFGRKPSDHDPAAFSGLHARHVLVIIDEAGGVAQSIWEAVDTLVTNEGSHVLAIGNPDDPSSHFETVCRPGSGWNVIPIDGLCTPGFTAEGVAPFPAVKELMEAEGIEPYAGVTPQSVKEVLLSPRWVDERIKRWGKTSGIFQSKVRGRFPEVSDDATISPYLVRIASALELVVDESAPPQVLAIDVASSGTDETVAYTYQNGRVRLAWRTQGADTMAAAGFAARWHTARPGTMIVVDYVGLGRGVYDRLREQDVPCIGFGGGETPRKKRQYANKRAEAWWTLRQALEATEIDLDPDDIDLAAQLQGPKWHTRSSGQIILESKDDMKKRGVSSPDRGDAVAMAVYYANRARPVARAGASNAIQSAIDRMGLRF